MGYKQSRQLGGFDDVVLYTSILFMSLSPLSNIYWHSQGGEGGQPDNIFLSMVMNCKITWAKMYQITESGRNEISTRV